MNIFQTVKENVTARQAAEQYGLKVNKNGMVCCPFHDDRHPSMKVDKERKSLEGRIELLEDLEKRLHKSLEQIVKREGYPNVQAFQKVYNKAEELIIEYNEEVRAWKNQTEQKKENPLEQPKKESVLEKLHRYQQEGRQQPKRSVKKKSMDRER